MLWTGIVLYVKNDMIEKIDLIIKSLKERKNKYKELQEQSSKVLGCIETLKAERLKHDPITSLLNIHNLWADKKYQSKSSKSSTKSSKGQRVFLKTSGSILSNKKNMQHLAAMRYTLMDFNSGAICSFIPKNACTNLRASFALSNGFISSINDVNWIHKNNTSQNATELQIQNADYTFVILRNPFWRITSCFIDKAVGDVNGNETDSYEICKNLHSIQENETTFEKFIENLYFDQSLIQEDLHLKRQGDFLVLTDYDDWLSVESYKSAATQIEKSCGISLVDTRSSSSHTTFGFEKMHILNAGELTIAELREIKSKNIIPKYESLYTEKTAFMVSSMYWSDIYLYILKIGITSEIESLLTMASSYAIQLTNDNFS